MLSESERQANQQYVEAMERLFASPDMQILLDDLEGYKAAIHSSLLTIPPDRLRFEQGRYEGLTQTTEHLKTVRSLVEQASADDILDSEDPHSV